MYWSNLLNPKNVDVARIAVVIFVCASIASVDMSTGMFSVLLSTKNGRRKTLNTKLLLACLISALIVVLFFLADFVMFKMTAPLPMGHAPVQSISSLSQIGSRITINEYLPLALVLQIMLYAIFSCVIVCLTYILKKGFSATIIAVTAVFITQLFAAIPQSQALLSVSDILNGAWLLERNKGVGYFSLAALLVIFSAALYICTYKRVETE